MERINPEFIKKAKQVKSAEELILLAKENKINLSSEEAEKYFERINPENASLSDDDLENVSGGAPDEDAIMPHIGRGVRVINGNTCPKCGRTEGYICYNPNDIFHHVKCFRDNTIISYIQLNTEIELI